MYISKNFTALPRSTPVEQGLSTINLEELNRALERTTASVRGYILVRHGKVIAEKYRSPYTDADKVWVYSVSKSFTSTAVGMAVDEGLLSLDDKVISFFPGHLPEAVSDNLSKMRVRDLLSMTSGHAFDTLDWLVKSDNPDWISLFLALPVELEPGSRFVYNSGASFMLSAIVQAVTGVNLLDYLTPRLFEPLGYGDIDWDINFKGIATGGWGLSIGMEDLAKLGLLYLNRGMWGGKRILSEKWIDEATRSHIDNSEQNSWIDWKQGYGFQFWRCQNNGFRADGAAGQLCVVMPDQDAVFCVLSETNDLQEIIDCLWSTAFKGFGNTISEMEEQISGKSCTLEPTADAYKCASFTFADSLLEFALTDSEGTEHKIRAGRGRWMDCETHMTLGFKSLVRFFEQASKPRKISAHFRWIGQNELSIEWVYRDTPHRDVLICKWDGEYVSMLCPKGEVSQNLGAVDVALRGRM